MKDRVLRFVNKPVANITSSQTLYEALFAAINMWVKYEKSRYKNQMEQIAKLIVDSQLADGGFDIGYNFSFGKNMKKKSYVESTTPEVLSIYALLKYYDVTHDESVKGTILRGIQWIKKHSYRYKEEYWVIPYAPCSYREVHITNAITFAVATLVYYMAVFKDDRVQDICDGMLRFMKDELIATDNNSGYWNYFDKDLMDDPYYIKVDNYHIAQQLYYHFQIDNYYPNEDNKEIIKLVSNYLKGKFTNSLHVPYIEIKEKKSDDIHTWGYCSLLTCSLHWGDQDLTKQIREFMIEKMWSGKHFYPVIKYNGDIVDNGYYPRSDAWLLHTFSEYLLYRDDVEVGEIVSTGLQSLEKCYYSGYENHVLTPRKKVFNKMVVMMKKILKK